MSDQDKEDFPSSRCLEIVDSLPEMIFEIDYDKNVTFCNAKGFEMTGYSQEEYAKGFKITQLIAPEDLQRAESNMAKIFSGGKSKGNEYTFIRKDGSRFPVSVTAVPIIYDGKQMGARGIITDLSQIKKTEKELNLLSLAIKTSIDGIIVRDENNIITFVNDSLLRMYGSPDKNELIGKNILLLLDESEREMAIQSYYRHKQTGQGWLSHYTALTKYGARLPVEITSNPIRDRNGVEIGHISIVRDISDRTRNEEGLKEAKRKLELSNEKLLVVGGLTRHDIANRINVIDLKLYLAKKSGKFEDIIPDIEVASSQIKRILAFSKDYEMLGTEQLSFINVGQVFDQVIGLFPDLTNIKITNDCMRLSVLADSLLKELFNNLVDNTRKYGEKTTQIKLSHRVNGETLKLIYEDDGVGIPAENKAKIFVKGFGKGTGLGLHLVKRTLEAYGWQIEEIGTQGNGVKFEITIPKTNLDRTNFTIS